MAQGPYSRQIRNVKLVYALHTGTVEPPHTSKSLNNPHFLPLQVATVSAVREGGSLSVFVPRFHIKARGRT